MRRTLALTAILAALALPGAAQTPVPTEPDIELEELSIRWMNLLDAGHFDSAAVHVSPRVITQLGEEQLQALWPQITVQVGEMQDLLPERHSTLEGLHIVTMAGTFDAGVFDVNVVFDGEGDVVGFSVRPPGGGPR